MPTPSITMQMTKKLLGSRESLYSTYVMAAGLSFHFLGYEWSRAASISLLSGSGLDSSALPFTVAVGAPFSALTLYFYTRSIKVNGAKHTFRCSSAVCTSIFAAMLFLGTLNPKGVYFQAAVVMFYAFREIYVTLLSTQLWSFIVSVLDKSTSSYIVSFGGIVSVASTLGGFSVEQIVHSLGVQGLLFGSTVTVFLTYLCGELAYLINSTTTNIQSSQKVSKSASDDSPTNEGKVPNHENSKYSVSVWRDSWNLVSQHTILQLLLVEAVMHQCCGNMLNMMFHDGLRQGVVDHGYRAVIVGRFFAFVNFSSCILQCFIMPHILCHATMPRVLACVPIIVLCVSSFALVLPNLLTVMFGFGTLKVLEYAVMTGATEMIYMPLEQDVRYLGKELVRFFGHKLGKSGASLLLSAANAHFAPSLVTQSLWTTFLTIGWCGVMSGLSLHLHARGQGEAAGEDQSTLELALPAVISRLWARTSAKLRHKAEKYGRMLRVNSKSMMSAAMLPEGKKTPHDDDVDFLVGASLCASHSEDSASDGHDFVADATSSESAPSEDDEEDSISVVDDQGIDLDFWDSIDGDDEIIQRAALDVTSSGALGLRHRGKQSDGRRSKQSSTSAENGRPQKTAKDCICGGFPISPNGHTLSCKASDAKLGPMMRVGSRFVSLNNLRENASD